MQGERILKSLLNREIDGLYEDTKNYLAPLQCPVKNKNGCQAGGKATEETVSKYAVFCTKFLRCAIETLKNVKAKGNDLTEVTDALKLVGTLLNNTLSLCHGNYLKFIPSVDQLAKTLYLIVAQLIAKAQFERALDHANDLYKFIQLLKAWKSYDSEKMDKEIGSLCLRSSDLLLQGAGKLEEAKVPPRERPSHLCVVLDWRKLSLLFQAEANVHSSLKSLVDKTLKCGTKFQVDCGLKNVDFQTLASFFKTIFSALMNKQEQLIANGQEFTVLLAELGFHYGRICNKAGNSTEALAVFDKLLKTAGNENHSKNGHFKLQIPSQVCCCVCLVCKAAILLNSTIKSQTQESLQQMLFESNWLISQILRCSTLPSPMLKLLSDSLEYFRINLQNESSQKSKEKSPTLSLKTLQATLQVLQSYISVLSLQCERLKSELLKSKHDNIVAQLQQQVLKTTERQMTVFSFVISSYQDQLKNEKDAKSSIRDSRCQIFKDCIPVVEQANSVIHSVLDDPDIPLSSNELRWLGCNVYNLGCVSYQRDCFTEGVPLLAIACEELRVWCFAGKTDEEIFTRTVEVKLLTKFALLTDCQRRAKQMGGALTTATTQVLITLQTGFDANVLRKQIKQWTTVKHELVKSMQDEKRQAEKSRTLCSVLAEQKDAEGIDSSQLCLVLQEELACYKAKNYDTTMEQISVIRQLMELYIIQDDEFHYGSVMLEFGVALHDLGDKDLEEEKSALECCQEAAAILERLADTAANTDEDKNHLSLVQDRLAAAYLWQALLKHKATMEDKPEAKSAEELSESYETEGVEGICLEQPFMSSLHSALETWTVLANRSVQEGTGRKIDWQHFVNLEETCHYLLIIAGMFGLVNQPFKKVCALHLAANIAQMISTNSMLDNRISACSEAVHTLCDVLDISNASLLLHQTSDVLETFEPSGSVMVQFLLAKSHYLLVAGKYSEGEQCLMEVLQSDALTQKSYRSHLLKARLMSLCAKYSMLPAKLHKFSITLDPVVGSLTALECALDGFHKLSHMAEEVFGKDVFSSGRKKGKQNKNVSAEGPLFLPSVNQSLFHMSLLNELLSSLLQVGQLYAQQGAVREAFRQFVDGLTLARHFALPYRIAEFLINITHLELKQGKGDKCESRLDQLNGLLQPVLKPSSRSKLAKNEIQEPLLLGHPETCECVNCIDTTLHNILIRYSLSVAKYLLYVSIPEQSGEALDLVHSVCQCAEKKMAMCVQRLGMILCGCACSAPSEGILKETKKKGKAKSTKGRKQKEDSGLKSCSVSQLMFCQYFASFYCMSAELSLQMGKIEEANEVLLKATEILHCAENSVGYNPMHLLPMKASILYMSGVATLLLNKGSSKDVCLDCNWFPETESKISSLENSVEKVDSSKVDIVEECEVEKPRKASGRRGRNSKPIEKSATEDTSSRPTSSRAKDRGRSKKAEGALAECDDSEANIQRKTKGRRKPTRSAKQPSNLVYGHKTAPKWMEQTIHYWNEAFVLCQVYPPPALFSDICRGLAFCHGRSAPQLSMYYLNLASSITLRHQAVTSTGKRIKRTAKGMTAALSVEHDGDMEQLAKELSSLSINDCSLSGIKPEDKNKLAHLLKTRSIMQFNSSSRGGGDLTSLFSPEELALLQDIPKEWTVCTLESFKLPGEEERQLLICRIRSGSEPVLVKINTTLGEEHVKEKEADDVVMDLCKLFQCNLMEEFNEIMTDNVKSMSISNTSEWWAQRTRLDSKMKILLEKLESCWLGRWKGVLLGQSINEDHQEATVSAARQLQGKITNLCACPPDIQLLEILVDSASHLSRDEKTDAISEIAGIDPKSSSLNEILRELEEVTSNSFSSVSKKTGQNSPEVVTRHPVILILGKDIQHLPWESIPMLFDHPVTRVPSLQFLLSKVSCQQQLTYVDPVKTFYALNPQNNLPNTQKMFQKWFESEDGWQGITGRAPTQDAFSKALTDHELFIYFGHGTGREFLQGDDIQRLDCRAVTVLMGCSSGKLTVGGECEPRGMALNYLLAGCPAIVANLWDVTDKDIDRFSDSLLKKWLQQDTHLSLADVLSLSRQACKLKYLIGASPVLYGLPAYTKQ